MDGTIDPKIQAEVDAYLALRADPVRLNAMLRSMLPGDDVPHCLSIRQGLDQGTGLFHEFAADEQSDIVGARKRPRRRKALPFDARTSKLVVHRMALDPNSVHVDTALSNMLVMLENRELIADNLMPVITVSKRSDVIFAFPPETLQSIANVSIASNRARPGEVSYSVNSSKNYKVKDYGLVDFVSADLEANADAPLQPRAASMQIIGNFLDLAREQRVSAAVFGSGNYGANTTGLSGSNRWDVSGSTPVQNWLDAILTPFVRPSHAVIGEQPWTKFRNNTDVTRFVTSRAATSLGPVPAFIDADFVAKAFDLEAVEIGRAKYVTSNEGAATTTYDWLWGKSCAFIKVEPAPNAKATKAWGFTFRFGPRLVMTIPELLAGRAGGVYVKVAMADDEVVLNGVDAGYLYTTVMS